MSNIGTATTTSAADLKTDQVLAKASAKLATDRRNDAAASVLKADQQAVKVATRAAQKADDAAAPAPAGAVSLKV